MLLCIQLEVKSARIVFFERMLKEVQNELLANSALASFTGVA